MKLRYKKTGQEGNFIINKDDHFECVDLEYVPEYRNLSELNEEWEDYEKPKDYWWISPVDTDVVHCVEDVKDEMDQYNKAIGNYFETKEEAEKAMEKLKAWKRLKDKEFRFHGHNALGVGEITFSLDFEDMDDEGEIGRLRYDLDLLFGGEE